MHSSKLNDAAGPNRDAATAITKHINSGTQTTRAEKHDSLQELKLVDSAGTTPENTGTAPTLTPAQFTQEITAALQQAAPDGNVRILNDLEFDFTLSKHPTVNLRLQNPYAKYMLNECPKDVLIAHYVSAFLEMANMDGSAAIDRSCIVPVLKRKDSLKYLGDPEDYTQRRISDDLIALYAVHGQNFLSFPPSTRYAHLNAAVEELHKIAVSNLSRIFPAPVIQEEGGAYQVNCGGKFDTSLIFLDAFWDKLPFKVAGEVVVAVPACTVLFVTGSECQEGIWNISLAAQEVYATHPHNLSCKLLVRRQGKFVPYEADLRRLINGWAAPQYAQKHYAVRNKNRRA